MPNTSLPWAALLYETLRVACFHVRAASRREVVRQGSVTTPTTTLLRCRSVQVSTSGQCRMALRKAQRLVSPRSQS
ncbi:MULTISPECIES: hypothetical protein [unclassified Nostoc]|uniref:hypothetical protein n=1 Tax=unclassified Nostoc TaxID=2593658 RepID=UPI002621A3F7|nr:hypothetical protein [Nostoc sp. S13]MDF5737921.1 hypothetical protein [Nostoc sp. S13]